MKLLTLSLLAYGGAMALSLSPLGPVDAQPDTASAVVSPTHGDWTLREREKWLSDRIDKSRDDGSLDRVEYDRARHSLDDLRQEEDRMKDHQHGELTDNQTQDLEARLDAMAAEIHWAHQQAFAKPW
ncbi:MAG: hypothetical protein JWO83_4325 [Caulobacteraceae bacterium]|jgi:hypothetical protein|nr:hypothetical protein [Caulobacteraceae bacterium]